MLSLVGPPLLVQAVYRALQIAHVNISQLSETKGSRVAFTQFPISPVLETVVPVTKRGRVMGTDIGYRTVVVPVYRVFCPVATAAVALLVLSYL